MAGSPQAANCKEGPLLPPVAPVALLTTRALQEPARTTHLQNKKHRFNQKIQQTRNVRPSTPKTQLSSRIRQPYLFWMHVKLFIYACCPKHTHRRLPLAYPVSFSRRGPIMDGKQRRAHPYHPSKNKMVADKHAARWSWRRPNKPSELRWTLGENCGRTRQ